MVTFTPFLYHCDTDVKMTTQAPPKPDPAAIYLQSKINAAIITSLSFSPSSKSGAGAAAPVVEVSAGEYNFGASDLNIYAASKGLTLVAKDDVGGIDGANMSAGGGVGCCGGGCGGDGSSSTSDGGVKLIFYPGYGVHIRDSVRVKVTGNFSIDYSPPWLNRVAGITLQLTNSSDCVIEGLTILSSPSMAITAFNGDGGHTFRGITYVGAADIPQSPSVGRRGNMSVSRDAMHFSDLRRGPMVENSFIGFSGDDFFNIHSSFMVLLECTSPSECLVLNCGCAPAINRTRPLYGANCPFATVRPGDHISFFTWPAADMIFHPVGGKNSSAHVQIQSVGEIAQPSLVQQQRMAEISNIMSGGGNTSGPWVQWLNSSFPCTASVLWNVTLKSPLSNSVYSSLQSGGSGISSSKSRRRSSRIINDRLGSSAVAVTSTVGPIILTVDELGSANALLRNNTFSQSACNIGRLKSEGSRVTNNTFMQATLRNLEVTPLLQYFEGPLHKLGNIDISNNIFIGEGAHPVHCGPLCERRVNISILSLPPYLVKSQNINFSRSQKETGTTTTTTTTTVSCFDLVGTPHECYGCPDCSRPSPWANVTMHNNLFG